MSGVLVILAQSQGPQIDLDNWVYLLLVLVIPALNALVSWIKKQREAGKPQALDDAEATEFEVVIDDDNEPVLRPVTRPPQPGTVARPAATPAASPGRTIPGPGAGPRTMPPLRPPPEPVVARPMPTPVGLPPMRPVTAPAPPNVPTFAAPPVASAPPAPPGPKPRTPRARPATAQPATRRTGHARTKAEQAEAAPEPDILAMRVRAEPVLRRLLAASAPGPAALRKAIILSEILSAPVALRPPRDASW